MTPSGNLARHWNVAEIQGLYGPFTFTERLLQKIWLRGEFDPVHAVTTDGRPLRVLHPGRWNLLGGPDFRGAHLRLGSEAVTGDIELHLHAGDWAAHAHATDGSYDRVILHVVLFPPGPGEPARRTDGTAIATLVLLPLLLHDLEEYAAEEAIETLARRTDWRAAEELARLPPAEARAVLRVHAEGRWRQKVYFARRRVERLGWAEACHHTTLEILGYRFNRTPMLKVAAQAPLARWGGGAVDLDEMFQAEAAGWSLQGVRPANHPRVRLGQYAAWIRARPDWPQRLQEASGDLPTAEVGSNDATSELRRHLRLPELREQFAAEIAGHAIAGSRLDNLICDGFLPLLAARAEGGRAGVWFHWYAGDLPPRVKMVLRALGVFNGCSQPACHGYAQGLLGWMLARESSVEVAARAEPLTAGVG